MPTVLLVEDNHDDQSLVRRALKVRANLVHLHVLDDGEQAVQFIKKPTLGPEHFVALILLDLKLPKLNGLELIPLFRGSEATSSTPIIVFTSSDEPQDIRESYRLGANSYVQKPIDYDSYMRVLTEVIGYWLDVSMLPVAARRQ